MKTTDDISPIDVVTRIASNPIGTRHYLAALVVTVLLVMLTSSIYSVWPLVTLSLLAGAAAFLGAVALAFHGVSRDLLDSVFPLQQEAARLRAKLTVLERRTCDSEADRDHWKSAVEQAAGGPVSGTPTDLIARQALRIRTLERALDKEPSGTPEGNEGDPS